MRETDLYDYQRRLDRIDESRINGNFEDPNGTKADIHTQRVSNGNPLISSTLFFTEQIIDLALSHSTQLCLHLQPYNLIRTNFRGSAPGL